jgi:hypothetical protein
MKNWKTKGPLAAAAILLALGTTAQGQDVIVCESLEGLNQTMDHLTFTNEEKDRPSLQGKLDEAQAKLDEGIVCDAGLKVSDFNNKVFRLATARKTKIGESAPGALRCALEGSEALAETWLDGCEPVGDPPRGKGPKK